jgi:hypothetical protein
MGGRADGRTNVRLHAVRPHHLLLIVLVACADVAPVGVPALNTSRMDGSASAMGWSLETAFNPATNDWEPFVAADPVAPYVYVLTTRYGGTPACPRDCPDPALVLKVSQDGGATFGPESFLCVCRGVSGQNDPQIAVARNGVVYAAWLNDYVPGVVFSRSIDHGRSWSDPRPVMRGVDFSDKPILAISPSGRNVYIAFNASDSYIVASHDYGATFAPPVRTNHDTRYYFANGGYVAPNGVVTFSEASYTQSSTGPVHIHTMRSSDGGRSWLTTLIDVVPEQPDCRNDGCPVDYLGPAVALGGDGSNGLLLVYNAAESPKGAQRIYVRRSTDGGVRWSERVDISGAPAGANSGFPAAIGAGAGDFRVWYMDNRNGPDLWNVWFRRSRDGGRTWSAEARLSNAASGGPYKSPAGFNLPYGDYGGIAVTNTGATFATWGEGRGYIGPGGSWLNQSMARGAGGIPVAFLGVGMPEKNGTTALLVRH